MTSYVTLVTPSCNTFRYDLQGMNILYVTYSYFLALLISKLTYQTKSESRCDLNESTQFENVVVWNGRSYVRKSMNMYNVHRTVRHCMSVSQ